MKYTLVRVIGNEFVEEVVRDPLLMSIRMDDGHGGVLEISNRVGGELIVRSRDKSLTIYPAASNTIIIKEVSP